MRNLVINKFLRQVFQRFHTFLWNAKRDRSVQKYNIACIIEYVLR